MRCFLLMVGLLGLFALPLQAEEKKPAEYCKVEIRGTLHFDSEKDELLHIQAIGFRARAAGKNLMFGENKELVALAKKLNGKTVLIHGHLGIWSPLTAGPPKEHVPYIQVTDIKAADDPVKLQEDKQAAEVAAKEAAELVKGLAVTGTVTKAIGNFCSPGRPVAGDTFEFAFDELPQEKLKFTTPDAQTHYIPLSAPLHVVHVKQQGEKISGPRRAAIHLSATDADRKFLIQVIAESLEKGSKVRIYVYENSGFLGSMAEGEGELK